MDSYSYDMPNNIGLNLRFKVMRPGKKAECVCVMPACISESQCYVHFLESVDEHYRLICVKTLWVKISLGANIVKACRYSVSRFSLHLQFSSGHDAVPLSAF